MFFQKMSVPVQSTVTVSSFLGLDRRARGELGSFREMENLTSDGYPTLTVRPRRGLAGLRAPCAAPEVPETAAAALWRGRLPGIQPDGGV